MKPLRKKRGIVILIMAILGLFLCFPFRRLIDPYPPVEMTSQEVINTWMEEQAQEAEEFFHAHEELFAQIVEAALDPEITSVYQNFSVSSSYSEPEALYLTEYHTVEEGSVHLGYGGYPDSEYYRSLFDLSPALEPVLNELLALRKPLSLTYTTQEDFFYRGALLQIGYSSKEFPTAIYCDVIFWYNPDRSPPQLFYELGNGWYIYSDYVYMYGL